MKRRGLLLAAAATACFSGVSAIDPGEGHVAPPMGENALPSTSFVPHVAMPHSGLPHWQHDEHPMVQGQMVGLPASAHGNSKILHPTAGGAAKEPPSAAEEVPEKPHTHTPEEDASKQNKAMLNSKGEGAEEKPHVHTPEEDAKAENKQMLRGGGAEEKPALLELEPPVSDSVAHPMPHNNGLPPHSFIPGSGAHSGLPHWQSHEHPHAQGHLGVPHLPSASHGITHNLNKKSGHGHHGEKGKGESAEEQEEDAKAPAEAGESANTEKQESDEAEKPSPDSKGEESFIEKKSQNPEAAEEAAGQNERTKLPPHYLRGNGITGETVIPGATNLEVSTPPQGIPPPNYISGAGIAGSVPIIGHQQSGIPQKVTFLEEQSKDPDAMKPEDGGLTNPPEEQFEHPPNGGLPAWSAHEHPYQNGFVPGKHNSDIHMNAHSVFVPLSSHPPAAEHAHLADNLPHNGMMPGRL
jgi:hypothetical protein|eukprot:g1750.t1